MVSQLLLERDGVRLAGLDFGGTGTRVLLLHGLAAHAGEWAETAGWLTTRCRVLALDARGHGGTGGASLSRSMSRGRRMRRTPCSQWNRSGLVG